MSKLSLSILLTLIVGVGGSSPALRADGPGWPLLGKIQPRPASQIASSDWSVGGETLDRDFTVYANYKKYLGPLGAKGIRLQAGWAKCEKTPGVYDWAWLDEIVDDALAQGVRPWLETSYGNTIYQGGGGTGLGGGLPKSPEALAAWDNWVRALARRYKDRVNQWEIWNEPDLWKANTALDYTDLFIRTAQIIRAEQPGARIYGLALASSLTFAKDFLDLLKEQDKLNLLDAVIIHGYPRNPDDTVNVDKMRGLLAQYSPAISVRQGETGAPSKFQPNFALSKLPWSENTQAKWNLRRMLAHHGKDVPFNMFALMDMHYIVKGEVQMNYKGLLAASPDQTVAYAKPAYFAAQRVFAVFDDSLERVRDFQAATTTADAPLAAFAYRKKQGGAVVATAWLNEAPPVESNAATPIDLTLSGVRFTEPVYADLLTGNVYAIARDRWSNGDGGTTFKQLPIYDSPVLVAEKTALPLDTKGAL